MTRDEGLSGGDWRGEALETAFGIRRRVLEHCIRNDGGYLSQACSSAETLSTLYLRTMRLGPSVAPPLPPPFPGAPGTPGVGYVNGAGYNGPQGPDLDRFFLSPAHYALVLYAALIETGRMAGEALEQFNKDGSSVEMIGAEHSPGFEAMGGALAQTLSQAAGLAKARLTRGETGRVFVFLSDGEFQEGQTWEAVQAMVFHRIGRLIAYVDLNGQQCDGPTREVMAMDPLEARLRAFGATVSVVDGHDPAALDAAAGEGRPDLPHFVLCLTDPCRGVDLLERRRPKLHYLRFVSAEEKAEYADYLGRLALRRPAVKGKG